MSTEEFLQRKKPYFSTAYLFIYLFIYFVVFFSHSFFIPFSFSN